MTDYSINPNNAKVQIGTDVDTIIHMIVDGSSSMARLRAKTLSGTNEFIAGQPKSKPDSRTLLSITEFTTSGYRGLELRPIRSYVDINDVESLTDNEYKTSGNTPLLDAIGECADETLAVTKTSPTPPAVVVVIITDGEENASQKFTNETIREKITHLTEVEKWSFVYLGANQDAFAVASQYGIAKGNTANFAAASMDGAFKAARGLVSGYTTSNSMLRSSMGKSMKYGSDELFEEAGIDNTKTIEK